jgi:hypothetical protein
LALFGRRPSVPGDSFVIPASENLHNCRQTLLKSLQEKPINNQRQGYTLQPLPTASPRGQARDPTRHIDAESFVFRPE